MKKYAVCFFLVIVLSGCSSSSDEMEKGMDLRSKLLKASQCSFDAKVTADYGDKIHTFSMNCIGEPEGKLKFTVTKPDTIAGISGEISAEGGKLTFDDVALCFELLAENQLSPISAPWILMNTLQSGYLVSACVENEKTRLSVDDRYEENSLRLDIWLNQNSLPQYADILYAGKRILSVSVTNFEIM